MYRDDGEAAQLRIQTLEAKLAERDAGLAARDAEIVELRSQVIRHGGQEPRRTWARVLPMLTGVIMGVVGFTMGLMISIRTPPGLRPPAGSTGVAACDLYIERFEGCVAKSPPAAADAMRAAAKTTRDALREAAESPEGRAALRSSCGQMLDSLAQNPMCRP